MIYTVTLNPAIDYVVKATAFEIGKINKSDRQTAFFAGKGINVSLVLKELGKKSTALGFIAGFTGEAIEKGLEAAGVNTDFVHLENGITRINVKIRSGVETDINGDGPHVNAKQLDTLFNKLKAIKNGDFLVLAGSVPTSIPCDVYEKIMQLLCEKNVKIIVDATGKSLLNTLKYKPFLIKPNTEELSEIFGKKITAAVDSLKYAKKLQEMGAVNVLVSMGENGAVLLDEFGNNYYAHAIKGDAVNTVGAGDSMVAGFLAGVIDGLDYKSSLSLATASGSATAFSEGLAKVDLINSLLKKSEITDCVK